jgi:hypothetical protein
MADNASIKQQSPAAAKNGASEEEQLEDMLYQLDQVHLQASLLQFHLSPPPWRCLF